MDEDWIRQETPFTGKPHARAFFDTFILPNYEQLEKWDNFVNNKLVRPSYSEFFASVINLADEQSNPSPAAAAAAPAQAADAAAARDVCWDDVESLNLVSPRRAARSIATSADAPIHTSTGSGGSGAMYALSIW